MTMDERISEILAAGGHIEGQILGITIECLRQLTRIADQGDDTAKARDQSIEQMMSALAATPPSPQTGLATDALVEAFQLLYHDRCHEHDEDCPFRESHEFCSKCRCGDNHDHRAIAYEMFEAAHEKAVK